MNHPAPRATHALIQIAGLIGLGGALLFFAGDMLFYGHFGSGAQFRHGMIETVQRASLLRLYVGGLVGPLAAMMALVGFWSVGQNVATKSPRLARVVFFCWVGAMVVGSAVHTLWVSRALVIKFGGGPEWASSPLGAAVRDYWSAAFNLAKLFGYPGAMLLLVLVLLGRTRYPRWAALANPGVLLLLSPLAELAPAPFGSLLVGGFTNLSLALFFAVCVTTTWKEPADRYPDLIDKPEDRRTKF